MIEIRNLSKRYGALTAVDDISFSVSAGQVLGFLGPNGAGKSTTMRMIVGLDRPTSGTVTVNGKPYTQHRSPLKEVGVLLVRVDAFTWRGFSYEWNEAQTDATLLPDMVGGLKKPVPTGQGAETQIWHFPSRAQCLQCHTQIASEFAMPAHHRLKEGVLDCSSCHSSVAWRLSTRTVQPGKNWSSCR